MLHLQVETTNVCSADCVFCPWGTMHRPKGRMTDALYHRILDDAATLPLITQVTLNGLGEPMLDRGLAERVAYARAQKPDATIDLYTNGTHFTPARAAALRDAGLSHVYVSLNAVRADQRKALMRVDDFTRVCGYLDEIIPDAGPMRVTVRAIWSNEFFEPEDIDTFRARWGEHAHATLENNWAGKMFTLPMKRHQPCARALGQIMVLRDGRVSLCCLDSEGKVIFGNLTTQTIKDVFNGPLATASRHAHAEGRRAEMPMCAGCTSG